jgi:hypothetical protein
VAKGSAKLAARKQAGEIARSAANRRSLIGADRDMLLTLDACALDNALANNALA